MHMNLCIHKQTCSSPGLVVQNGCKRSRSEVSSKSRPIACTAQRRVRQCPKELRWRESIRHGGLGGCERGK